MRVEQGKENDLYRNQSSVTFLTPVFAYSGRVRWGRLDSGLMSA